MKKILITGRNSYIGNAVKNWLEKVGYNVESIDVHGSGWEKISFRDYDVLIHVAGIVHQRETESNRHLYHEVNTVLAVKIFKKAMREGVKQFIFFSSGAVFTQSDKKNRIIMIDEQSKCHPRTEYGKSKHNAELGMLKALRNRNEEEKDNFKLAIIRPPMVYGPGAKGNYNSLAQAAVKLPVFPYVKNQRSVLFIDNLCECVRLIIENNDEGFFYPQDGEYICTSDMVRLIANCHGRKIVLIPGFGFFFSIMGNCVNMVNKVFGTFIYDKKLSEHYGGCYRVRTFKEGIRITEKLGEN